MNKSIITISILSVLFMWGLVAAYDEGQKNEAEKWRQRMMDEGFSVVTRYDTITGEPRQVLIKLNKEAGK